MLNPAEHLGTVGNPARPDPAVWALLSMVHPLGHPWKTCTNTTNAQDIGAQPAYAHAARAETEMRLASAPPVAGGPCKMAVRLRTQLHANAYLVHECHCTSAQPRGAWYRWPRARMHAERPHRTVADRMHACQHGRM